MEKSLRINPYTVPEDQHGWRGLSFPGNHKRKWYTILHNDKVLVTALLLIPGERGFRHSHGSGELSVSYSGDLKPMVSWHPPGVWHGGPPVTEDIAQGVAESLMPADSSNPEVARLIKQISQMQLQISHLQQALQDLRKPEPSPRVLVDIIFPPFETTIDDPEQGVKKTVVGQWYD